MTLDLLSVRRAAEEFPQRLAIRRSLAEGGDLSFSQLAELVEQRIAEIEQEGRTKIYPLVVHPNTDSLVSVYALLELHTPILVLHPSLTETEKQRFLAQVDTFTDPLPEDTAIIVFTSGPTGKPKATILTRKALISSAQSSAKNIPLEEGDVWQLSIAPARIGGFSIVSRSLIARTAISFAPKFSAKAYTESWDRDGVTLSSIVPTMLIKVLEDCPEWRPSKNFKTFLVGGAATSDKSRKLAFERHLPLVMTYGMTETASNVVSTPFEMRYSITKGNGKINPGAEIKIVDGRVLIRGPMLLEGYWGRETKDENGWFDSGDLGHIDEEGYVYVKGRAKDVILSGGDNVYPQEVEEALENIPGIKQALVLGKPDETWGAIVTALLVPENEASKPEAKDIVFGLSNVLATYKSPRLISWVRQLPVNASGKLNRRPEVLEGLTFEVLHYTAKNK